MGKELQHIHISDEEISTGDVQMLITPLWYSVSIYDGEERYNSDLSVFSVQQRHVFAVQWYLAEVYNGGHDQFFFNSTGIVWRDALEGFRAIGLQECAAILSEAARRMGGAPSSDREARWAIMDELEPEFGDLDSRLYKMDDEELKNSMMKYILDHKESFYFDGDIEVYV